MQFSDTKQEISNTDTQIFHAQWKNTFQVTLGGWFHLYDVLKKGEL
jgi:hypothetical protein